MARWSIRNYNAFIRAARKKADLTPGQAKTVYRQMSQKLGRPLTGTDIKKHPRIFGKSERIATGAASSKIRVTPGEKPRVTGGGGSSSGTVGSIRQWEKQIAGYDDFSDYGYDEYESSADYGEVNA